LNAQLLDNKSLTGKYFFRHVLLVNNASGGLTDANSLSGSFVFSGSGAFTYNGTQTSGPGDVKAVNGSGTYTVSSGGIVSMTNPQRNGALINSRLGSAALVGSSTETSGITDFLIAVPAPAGGVSEASMSGLWYGSTLEFPQASASVVRGASVRLTPNGQGTFGDVTVNGHAANLGDKPLSQTVQGATYALFADGTGKMDFPIPPSLGSQAQLLGGSKSVFLSADGNLLIGGSIAGGGHDIFIAMKALTGTQALSAFNGRFWGAGMKLERGRLSSFSGSASSNGKGALVWSRRVRAPEGLSDFTGVNNYALSSNSPGVLQGDLLALSADAQAFAAVNVLQFDSDNYELLFGIRMPEVSGSGVFLNPQGIVNAASFAPAGAPVSPGSFITLFGSGLAPKQEIAASLPFPKTLSGVQVLVNGIPSALYLVASTQISALIPFAATGSTATIVVNNNGVSSNTVVLPLAKTSPGIFTVPPAGIGAGAILHANFSLVSSGARAKRGEAVQIFLTGLGAVTPGVADGASAPSTTLSILQAPVNVYIGGKRADVFFQGLAPGLAGLYQLNVFVPMDAPTGTSIPLAVETIDGFHDQVDIAVAQ
jgi:uncharacterized protein (TIGR03437 family)